MSETEGYEGSETKTSEWDVEVADDKEGFNTIYDYQNSMFGKFCRS